MKLSLVFTLSVVLAGVTMTSARTPYTDCFCTTEYVPVCGDNGVTYGNACWAKCAGRSVVRQGECNTDRRPLLRSNTTGTTGDC